MSSPAVLFDIDGTLVDTNYLHVHAWHRAFAEVGEDVESWRIHHRIGMDGSELLADLLPETPMTWLNAPRTCIPASTGRRRV